MRKRPEMYCGSTGDKGLLQVAAEPISNGVDLYLAGTATTVRSTIHADGSFEAIDDGPGMDLSDPTVLRWFEEFHNSPTADDHRPHIHIGRVGLGLAPVNFLSERLVVRTRFAGQYQRVEWTRGGAERSVSLDHDDSSEPVQGTIIRFWPDRSIFKDDAAFPEKLIADRLQEAAALMPGVRLSLNDTEWHYPDWKVGLAAVVGVANRTAGVEVCTFAEDETEITTRLLLCRPEAYGLVETRVSTFRVRGPNTEQRLPLKIYANCASMDDKGDYMLRLAEELEQTNAVNDDRLAALVALTMAGPKITGPTRARLDDQRAFEALEQVIAEEWSTLVAELG